MDRRSVSIIHIVQLVHSTIIILLPLCIILSNGNPTDDDGGGGQAPENRKVFSKLLVNTPYCKIPECPLFPEAIKPEWKINVKTECEAQEEFARITPKMNLVLNENTVERNVNCCYLEVLRPYKLKSDKFTVSDCYEILPEDLIDASSMEFIMVNCTESNGGNLPPQFLYQFPKPKKIKRKIKFWEKHKGNMPFSIMYIFLDSISRTHAYRGLPKSMDFLLKKLNFIEYKAYHTLGEPTIENYIPFTLGRVTTDTADWDRHPPNYEGKYDSLPFIWNNFSSTKYVTMNIEDEPNWHTFNFNGRKGFTYKPFDYTTRAYMLAQDKYKFKQSRSKYRVSFGETTFEYYAEHCLDGANVWNAVFNYTMNFYEAFNPAEVPSFSINFLSWPFHNYLFGIRRIDEDLLELLKYFKAREDILENTFIFLLADHGFRWSNYSETQEGLLERDLPMLYIRPPNGFEKRYPDLAANLKSNADKVTTHIDMFKTMAHLHELTLDEYFNGSTKYEPKGKRSYGYSKPYGRSLLLKIPANRTCEDAQILPAFCACGYPTTSKDFVYKNFKKYIVVEGFEKERG